jgi:two-component system, NtrC family, response regulator AtoC
MTSRVLVVDDDAEMCSMLEGALGRRGFAVTSRTAADQAFALLAEADFDAVITDLQMKGMNGLELCERISQNRPDIPVLVMTAFGSFETAVAAIRVGAYDFITKPVDMEPLRLALERAVRHRALTREVRLLRQAVREARRFEELIGTSPAMGQVYDLIERVAEVDATVLITGESGTGKEMVARAIHRRSKRSAGRFVAVNCAAVPEALLESELFGHEKGAFTDARTARSGLFVEASGGTLFLDEIGELPVALQSKLLRALQERTVRPVGASREVPFDARLLAATNRDLESAVEERRFRDDLYYRINVVNLALPPLRARGGDVLLLAQHFLDHFTRMFDKPVTGIAPAAADKLQAYSWPGNVRELANCIERAVALTRFAELVVEDLPEKIRAYARSHVVVAGSDPTELVPLEAVERRYILHVLDAVGRNRTLAAQTLGLDRKTLYRKLKSYGAEGE